MWFRNELSSLAEVSLYSRSITEEEFRRQERESFSICTLINEILRSSKSLVNIYETTRRHVPEKSYLELLPFLLPVYALLCLVSVVTGRYCTVGCLVSVVTGRYCTVGCLVSVVTGRYCTVGTTSAKSSIHRKCRKRVFVISSLLCARAASCCEDVALKFDYYSKCCVANDSNNNHCTRGLLSDIPFLPDIDLNSSMSVASFVWKLFCAKINQECKYAVQYQVYVFWKYFAYLIGFFVNVFQIQYNVVC